MRDEINVSAADIDGVLKYLEMLESIPDMMKAKGDRHKAGMICRDDGAYKFDYKSFYEANRNIFDIESKITKALYEHNFILNGFDWGDWIKENNKYSDNNPNHEEMIRSADLDTIRKIFTSIVRGDRFNEFLLFNLLQKGYVLKLFRRLKEIRREIDR